MYIYLYVYVSDYTCICSHIYSKYNMFKKKSKFYFFNNSNINIYTGMYNI